MNAETKMNVAMWFDSICRTAWGWIKNAWNRVRCRKLRRKFINAVNYVPTDRGRMLINVQFEDSELIEGSNILKYRPGLPKGTAKLSPAEVAWRENFGKIIAVQNEELHRIREEFKQKNLQN